MTYVKEDQYLFCLAMTCKSFFSAVCDMHWKSSPSHLKRVPVKYMFKRCELNVLQYLHSMNFVANAKESDISFNRSIGTLQEWQRICDYVQDHMLVLPGDLMLEMVNDDFVEMIEYAIRKKWYHVEYFNYYFDNARSVAALNLIADIAPSNGLTDTDLEWWDEAHFAWWPQNVHREKFTSRDFFRLYEAKGALKHAERVCSFSVLKSFVPFVCGGSFENRPDCTNLGDKVTMLLPYDRCACGKPANHDPKNLRPKKRLKF